MRGSWRLARRVLFGTAGTLLLVVGVAGLVLPGPGLLIMFAGIAVLSLEFEWAERRVDYIRDKAMDAAEYGVATWPRILISVAGGLGVVVAGVIWIVDPRIPTIWIIGPELPFGGIGTGIGMEISAVVAFFLLAYSYWRFRKNNRFSKNHVDSP